MATTVTVNANVAPALANLRKLEKQVEGINKSFAGLGRIVSGLAFGTFITNMLKSADAIDELSKATGVGIAEINGLSSAFLANGGDAESAQNSIVKLNQAIQEAAEGSAKTQFEFNKVGVSLQDLRTLSEGDILRKTIEGLAKLPPSAERTALAMSLLGKNVKTVDFAGVNQDLDGFITKSKQAEPGIKNAADLFSNLQNISKEFTTELLSSASGLTGTLKELTSNTKEIAKSLADLTKVVILLGGSLLILTKGTKILTGLGNAIALLSAGSGFLKGQLGALGKAFVSIFTNLAKVVPMVAKFFGLVTQFGGMTSFLFALKSLASFALRFAGLAGLLYGIASAVDFVVEKFTGFSIFEWVGEKATMLGGKIKQLAKDLGLINEAAAAPSKGPPTRNGPRGAAGKEQRDIADGNVQLANSIKEVTDKYKQQNEQIIRNLGLEQSYLKMSEDNVEIAKAQQEVYDRAIEAITELQSKKAVLKPEERGLAKEIDNQIKVIEQSIITDQLRAETAIKNVQAMRNAQEALRKSIEDTQRTMQQNEALAQLQEELNLIGLYGDELEKQTRINEINRDLRSQMIDLSMQLLQLDAQRTQIGEQNYAQERQRLVQQMADAQTLAEARVKAFEVQKERELEIENSYAEGVQRSIADIAEQFKPINLAQEAVKKGWDSIGSAVDTFVQTGKFKFSDFAKSVLKDLTAMILKATIFKAISGALGFFGIKLPGLAEGGPAKAGQPYIVGEKGPELFVPQNSGTVVPNNQLGARGTATGQVNAPVTNNYITNNINALDAKSVAQLFAENRKTLLGVTETARRELAYGR